jgi:hypothetical protein
MTREAQNKKLHAGFVVDAAVPRLTGSTAVKEQKA